MNFEPDAGSTQPTAAPLGSESAIRQPPKFEPDAAPTALNPPKGETVIRAPQGFMERRRARVAQGVDPLFAIASELVGSGLRAVPGQFGPALADPVSNALALTPADIVANMVTPGVGRGVGLVKGAFQRAAAAGTAGGLAAGASGENPLTAGLIYAASQLGGEALAAPLRLGLGARELKKARTAGREAFEQGTRSAEQRDLRAQRWHEVRGRLEPEAHRAATAQFADDTAAKIAEAWRLRTPAWRGYPASREGLVDMVYGRGQADLSKSFDRALRDVIDEGRGQLIRVVENDLKPLNIKPSQWLDEVRADGQRTALVDAGLVAGRVVGTGGKHPGLYSRVVGELDRMGIGDPAARADYKTGLALIEFVDRGKLLEGKVFHPDRVPKALSDLKTLADLRRRTSDDALRGIFAGLGDPPAAPPTRVAPAKSPRPAEPASVPPGFRVRAVPGVQHPYLLGSAVELPFALAGHHLYGSPFIVGSSLGHLLRGGELVTKAPLRPATDEALRFASSAIGQGIRGATRETPR